MLKNKKYKVNINNSKTFNSNSFKPSMIIQSILLNLIQTASSQREGQMNQDFREEPRMTNSDRKNHKWSIRLGMARKKLRYLGNQLRNLRKTNR